MHKRVGGGMKFIYFITKMYASCVLYAAIFKVRLSYKLSIISHSLRPLPLTTILLLNCNARFCMLFLVLKSNY